MKALYGRFGLDVVVFTSGALVMIFEIVGSRIVSPFIGASTYIWTSLIGVILGCLSLGYWIGGRLADRQPNAKMLGTAMFFAGGLVALTVLLKDIALSFIADVPVSIEIKALIASTLLFGPASVCFGVVTPYAVRLRMSSIDLSGSTVGRLYALSTIGSIVGTFLAGFILIPFVGSVRTLYLISGTAMVMAFFIAPLALTRMNIAAISTLALGIAASEANFWVLRSAEVHDIDTQYSRVQVFETHDPKTGRPIKALATDPFFVQSAQFLDSDELVLDYSRYYHLISHFKPDVQRSLLIGGAGYSFPRSYLKTYPDAQIDVVEIDPGMTRIARNHFGLTDDPRMNIIHLDGRMFINSAPSDAYDAVFMDAFGSLFSVPHHLTTLEAAWQQHRILKDGGVMIFNLGAAISGEASHFLHAELSTYRRVFAEVLLFKVNADYEDSRLQNLIIVALKEPSGRIDTTNPSVSELLSHRYDINRLPKGTILTDDLAPVEYFNSIAQNRYFADRLSHRNP